MEKDMDVFKENKYSSLEAKKKFFTNLRSHLKNDYPRIKNTDYKIVVTKDYKEFYIVDFIESTKKEEFLSNRYDFIGMYHQLVQPIPKSDIEFSNWYKFLESINDRMYFDIHTEYKSKRKVV